MPIQTIRKPAPASSHRRHHQAPREVIHLVMPGLEVARAAPRRRETVAAFLRRTSWARHDRDYDWQFRKGLPTILEIEAVLRKEWRKRRIAANDNVRFVSYPLGGGGNGLKQVVGLVRAGRGVGLAIWAGPLVASALGFGGSALAGGLARRRSASAARC